MSALLPQAEAGSHLKNFTWSALRAAKLAGKARRSRPTSYGGALYAGLTIAHASLQVINSWIDLCRSEAGRRTRVELQ
jgi:hypothetical protein